jgi:magnesium transporter
MHLLVMSKKHPKTRKQTGLAPGTMVFTGTRKVDEVKVHYLKYNTTEIFETEYTSHDAVKVIPVDQELVDWYDVRGLHDTDLIESIGKSFEVHPLVLEDIVDVRQRPKYDEYPLGNFIIARALSFDKDLREIIIEQVAIYFNKGLLLSFQENKSDLFIDIRNRLRTSGGKVRSRGADYLCYALIDALVDNYFVVLDEIEDEIDTIEQRLLIDPDEKIKIDIHHLKRETLKVRKSITPLRDSVSRFSNSDSPYVDQGTELYLRDLNDHVIQIVDISETYRDVLNGLQDLYLSEVSNRMNQVMKVLTVVTTIFVPLSFLTGLYGMNFVDIPELQNPNGYFYLLGAMVLIFLALVVYFKRKKWF